MGRPKKTRGMRKQRRLNEVEEISRLNKWIESQRPDSGSNPLSLGPLPKDASIGKNGTVFSRYAGVERFDQLPISDKTKRGLKVAKYVRMSAVQRAALPHALCGRDILGAAKTGKGKTLAFVIPILEKLHRERWSPADGVGCIIISPTGPLADQTFKELNKVGKFHKFSAGLLTGGREGVDVEKERVNEMNILVCTPGRLLHHMDETPNFECSHLQILILDEADRVLDSAFKGQLDAIISQLPKHRQTLLFSATQTKKAKDLARLNLRDPEYISVHEESVTATPNSLKETVMIVPVEKKLDMLWSFIKTNLNSRILVFLSTRKQVKFVHEAFNKLQPGIPLKSLHGKMSQERRMGVYSQFIERKSVSVLFCTDVLARGLDFDKGSIDWVVQVDCPEDVDTYIHRVGRTARFGTQGKSLLFLTPSEEKMVERLHEARVPVKRIKLLKTPPDFSKRLAALLVKNIDLQAVAQRAFDTYLRSIHKRRDKEIFDVTKLSKKNFSASLGLPMNAQEDEAPMVVKKDLLGEDLEEEDFALKPTHEEGKEGEKSTKDQEVTIFRPRTRVLKNKKLKINPNRPVNGSRRLVYDEEGKSLAPFASVAAAATGTEVVTLDEEKKNDYYKKKKAEVRKADAEDKKVEREKMRERRMKPKIKRKRASMEEEEEEETGRDHKRAKKTIFDDEEENQGGKINNIDSSVSIAELEELALKFITQS